MPSILPGKFDGGDFDAWLHEFDACCAANGCKVTDVNDEKIVKLPINLLLYHFLHAVTLYMYLILLFLG